MNENWLQLSGVVNDKVVVLDKREVESIEYDPTVPYRVELWMKSGMVCAIKWTGDINELCKLITGS